MGDKRAAATSGGSGLLMAGGIIALLVAVALYLTYRGDSQLDEAARAALSKVADQPVAHNATPELSTRGAVTAQRSEREVEAEDPPGDLLQDSPQTPADGDAALSQQAGDVPEAAAPSVDEVRVEADGLLVIAGRAEPGARVEVIVDGEVVSEAEADAGGSFAALGTVAPTADAQALSLRADAGAGALNSEAEIILAPVPAPADAPLPQALPAPVMAEVTAPAQPKVADTADDAERREAPTDRIPQDDVGAEPPAVTQQIAVLRSDSSGVSLLETELTEAVVLDTIGYSREGVVQLGGRAGRDASSVRAYLDNEPVARLAVAADGTWRGDVPDVAAGVYTLRIDALSAAGVVTSRIETPFQREAPEALAVADAASGPLRAVTVQAGDTLWAIARDRYGEGTLFVQVFEANRSAIRDPDLIYPGQVFDLPAD